MPRYFFNVHMGEYTLRDPDGIELTSVDSAPASEWEHYLRAALTGEDEAALAGARFEVTDELGRPVASVLIESPVSQRKRLTEH
jgi:hypothetical protein